MSIRAWVAVALAIMLAVAIHNISQEWQIRKLTRIASEQLLLGSSPRAVDGLPDPSGLSARAALITASILARHSGQVAERLRPAYIAKAEIYAAEAARQRPGWAQVTIITIYLRQIHQARREFESNDLLRRSYAEAPFLRAEGDWRVQKVVAGWQSADEPLRMRAMQEAAWLASLSWPMRVHMSLLLTKTPAERSYRGVKASEFPDR